MSSWVIYSIGFLAQLLFSTRLITQWFLSEKAKKVKTPTVYWKLSLLAALLLFIYGYLRNDLPIMIGQVLIYGVYFRNLKLQHEWKSSRLIFKITVFLAPILIASYLLLFSQKQKSDFLQNEDIAMWLIILGVIGQLVYTCRFIYQWIYSEKYKKSSLPKGFWILSLSGSALIFTYAIFRKDPVLLAAHFFGAIVYIRNLFLIKKNND
ncbi:lipid A biosynthesis-like protein [Gillisia sp. Hel_I_86]|uniref:lipid-A-disaccharide synthase N-terminal domain-containing protein n=1 Tax=Gillisia sp. Hel_I_86 TaxID=1249981 RepID=UPI00119B7488|nr:lipid-A-disaccharide synthase N-terminal domain-containing protein [Gillisia sp. Hel_I_86]TVZ26660.1 lipid A biosynthesis-like protein [Gillisia sp. Hel_I_86]